MEGGENTEEGSGRNESETMQQEQPPSMKAPVQPPPPPPPAPTIQKDPPEEKATGEATSSQTSSDATNSTSDGSSTSSSAASISSSNSKDDDEDDVTSKAAVALAAVAAAASATHKSPAEAAAQARAHAQSFLANGDDPGGNVASHGEPQVWKRVRLKAVQRELAARAEEHPALAPVMEHVGRNQGFLEYLLLLEYFQCVVEDQDADGQRGDDPPETKETEALQDEAAMATVASERLVSVLKKIEGAYESLLNLLPATAGETHQNTSFESSLEHGHPTMSSSDDYDTTVAVPDLLPPCTAQGDPTLAFFRACIMAEERKYSTSSVGSAGGNDGSIENSGSRDQADSVTEAAGKSKTPSTPKTAVSSMFGNMFKRGSATPKSGGSGASSLLSSLRRKSGKNNNNSKDEEDGTVLSEATSTGSAGANQESMGLRPGEYAVKIEREMLGLTVENVLERTVVRTVLAGGPAKKAGAKVGSLIVKVGNVETKNLTHFETIDELRQSQRPLLLVLKQLTEDSLRAAREEMGRLIRGAGYGTIMDGNAQPSKASEQTANTTAEGGDAVRPLIGADLRLDAFTTFLKRRLAASAAVTKTVNNNAAGTNNKKEEGIQRAGYKLIWILTMFVFGLEREVRLMNSDSDESAGSANTSHLQQHTLKEYSDSAKSAAKVLLDFTRKRIDPSGVKEKDIAGGAAQNLARRRKGAPPPPPPPLPGRGNLRRGPGANRGGMDDSSVAHEKPLLQIGDVLQRTRTFLAATTSPPAALLRGEVIALLCDILDVDTEMELSEEESASATSGRQAAGAINDLGSAGSLLKLIVLNYTIMRSPVNDEPVDALGLDGDSDWAEDLRRKATGKDRFSGAHTGNRFLAVVHRLAASRSMSARITACSLGPVMWGHLDFPHQLQLRGVITRALHDVEVLVRKATANVLHEIAELVFDARCVPWLVLMCERAMTDPEPQLRSAAMTLTWHLAEHLPNAFLGDASQGSRYLRRLPDRNDPIFADVYLLQCKLLPVATRLAEDRSPSVRLAVAAQCDRLCDALGDHWSSVVIDVLLGLLSDPDERVRCEAVMCVPRLASIVLLSSPPGASVSEVSILEALVPASIRLQKDSVAVVRVALASAAGELLTLLVALQGRTDENPPDETSQESFRRYKKQVDERLIPLVQILLNDQDPEVTSASLRAVTNASRRSSTITPNRHRHQSVASEDDSASVTSLHSHASRENRQPVFLPVLSEVQVLRLLPTLSSLANGKQWRVRQSAVEIVPALLGCTQKLETRTEISKLCVRLMGDKVDEVRRTAAECLCMGGSSLGSHGEDASSEWFERIVVPAIKEFSSHSSSKQRLLSLKMVEIILLNGACPSKWKPSVAGESNLKESPVSELISIALSLCEDRIANVRLNVGRVLETILHLLSAEDLALVAERVGQQLMTEQNGVNGPHDRDVIFYGARCVSRARQLMEDQASESAAL